MSTGKVVGGSLGAIVLLVITQVVAQLFAMILDLIHVPAVICNIIAGGVYLILAYYSIKIFIKKIIKLSMSDMAMPYIKIQVKWLLVAIILPLVVKASYVLFLDGDFIYNNMSSSQIASRLGSGIFFVGIAAGFVEEMVFRGVILNLLKRKWGTKIAVIVPSLLFGIVHIMGMNFNLLSCVLVIVAGTMVGIMFSMIALESGSIWNSGIVHAIWNIVISAGGLAIGEKMDEYSMVTYVLQSKTFILTGGEFGIESSLIALIAYTVVTLLAIIMIKKRHNYKIF